MEPAHSVKVELAAGRVEAAAEDTMVEEGVGTEVVVVVALVGLIQQLRRVLATAYAAHQMWR